ncbi:MULTISPECIES: HvfC/BufC N-terminal domain-containing protein [unclassified Sphingomonas]|uniref:HvfC/BufC N-terminal domain-containing protein n=1 Tax=unclassified Sphingomonas TaxID=196159 RepID=UPI0006FB7F47|nr:MULTISPECIES: DNA-binding domain-containing protein [unclassified Sphingomonas]KQX20707.1 hypothetical protein ASD17_07330 [Sphingomonas sp. Root1294]KQY68553.1 hypothetical protein ASD39_03850 [Sphingomonas sp. Root50]KRB87959.1 hypothetical protein ASE22_21025 [Sphingomonas sp. Root720]
MSLVALQRDFRAWLVDGDTAAAARIGDRATAGLAVYQNNYRAQLVACLEEAFERVHAWLGDGAFRAAAAAHIDAAPPGHWTLDAYPSGFVATLAALYPDDPEVAELGWLDHALADAFAGPDAEPLALDVAAAIDWDAAVLPLSPTLAIADATTNAAAIWSALSAGEMPPPARRLDEPAALIVWRQGYAPCFRTIDARERRLLAQARAGRTFGDLCASLTDELGARGGIAAAGAVLGQWLRDGLIVGGR